MPAQLSKFRFGGFSPSQATRADIGFDILQ
jgi:hypothetical protein